MANFIPNTSSLLLTIYCTWGEQTSINTLGLIPEASEGQSTDMEKVLVQVNTALTEIIRGVLPSTAKLWGYKCEVYPNPQQIYRPSFLKLIANNEGLEGTLVLPTQCCALLYKSTNQGGRANRGRMYAPFVPNTFYDGGNKISADAQDAYANIGVVLVQPLTLSGVTPSRIFKWGLPHVNQGTYSAITSVQVSDTIATQRRRGGFGRPNKPPY